MNAQTVFYLFIGFIILDFIIEQYLDWLNAKHFNDKLPPELNDIFDEEEYRKSQAYKLTNYRFSSLTSIISLVAILIFLFLEGFARLDHFVSKLTDNQMLESLFFLGILLVASSLLTLPFSYYQTFVIEEEFGFNKSTRKLFFADQIKSLLISIIIGGILIAAFIWFYQKTGTNFWWYAWIILAVFSVLINMFYTSLIVPLFNKLTPLEEGELKEKLLELANKVFYNLDKIFVIDGSKRSSKANAYFSGFGPKKKVVLYDTLIHDLSPDEISAVLAHEIGHYKKKHIIYNLFISLLSTGVMLYLLSLLIDSPVMAQALGLQQPKFHIGLIAFALLFTPVSLVLGILTNGLSRKFEYQADAYATLYKDPKYLISALKKLSKKSLSNLTPHPWYVIVNYSHPPLKDRIKALNSRKNVNFDLKNN
jgi:STE24 endopeptidase